MEEKRKIENRELLQKVQSIKKQSQFIRACENLGFRITNGGKHPYVVRDPDNLENGDFRSAVTTIPSHLHKIVNRKILEQILNSPVSQRMEVTEEKIEKAFGFL